MTARQADFVAMRSDDPAELAACSRWVRALGSFEEAKGPPGPWVAAAAERTGGGAAVSGPGDGGFLFAEGAERVGSAGMSWPAISDLAQRQPERLAQLPGDFTFLEVCDDGSAIAVRSAGGLAPVYLAGAAGRWTVTTTLAHMLLLCPDELRLDPLINAIWSTGHDAAPDRRTFVSGVTCLRRGEYVRLGPQRLEFGRWWNPRATAEPAVDPDHPARLRALLHQGLERQLEQGETHMVALSGGVDSSALTALTAGRLGRPVHSLTVLSDDDAARTRDLAYIQALDRSVGLARRHEFVVSASQRLDLLGELDVPFHTPQAYLSLLPAALEADGEAPATLISGEFADQVTGSAKTRFDLARHSRLHEVLTRPAGGRRERLAEWAAFRARAALRRPRVPWPRQLPGYVRPALNEEYREWFASRRSQAAGDAGPLPFLAMQMEHDGFLAMNWEVTGSLGIRRSLPFTGREVLELAFECHPQELIGKSNKQLLRAALEADVPAFNLQRPDKGEGAASAGYGPRRWVGDIPAEARAVFADGWPPAGDTHYWDVFRTRQVVAFAEAFRRWCSRGRALRGSTSGGRK